MKFQVYSMTKSDKVEQSIKDALAYFKKIEVNFSKVEYVKSKESDKSLYEVVLSWALSKLRPTKSLRTDFLATFDIKDADGLILFVDKSKAKEDESLFGQNTFWINGKPYIEVYVSSKFYKVWVAEDGSFGEGYTSNKIGSIRTQVSQTLIHEVMHAYSGFIKVPDILHPFIEEGQFDAYEHYLAVNTKPMFESKIFNVAFQLVGQDVTPRDVVPDVVACAETVSTIINKVLNDFPVIPGTYTLAERLKSDKRFERIDQPEKGAILIYPTGTGNGNVSNGHVFICDEFNGGATKLYSNSSANGIFTQNYTYDSARKYYLSKGGFAELIFRLKS